MYHPACSIPEKWIVANVVVLLSYPISLFPPFLDISTVGHGVREGEVQEKNETGPIQEQVTFNEVRRGSSQISELLHHPKKRVSIHRHVCGNLLSKGGLFSKVVQSNSLLNGWGKEFWRSARGWTGWELGKSTLVSIFFSLGERVLCFA